MAKVTYHGDLTEVQGIPALAALLDAQTAPFDRREWFAALAGHCGLKPVFALACEGDRAALLPLMETRDGLAALANWYSFRWHPLLSPGAGPLLAAIARDLAGRTHRLLLAPLPDESGETQALALALRGAGWRLATDRCDSNHVLPVAGRSFATCLQSRPGALRGTLKRKRRQVEIVLHRRFDADAWEHYEAIYRASWKPEEGAPAFLRSFAETEGAAGRLRLGIGYTGGGAPRAIAAQLWTVEHGTAFIHKLAHDQAAASLSPGTVLTAALLEEVIERDRVGLVDFGTGDDRYKRDWMDSVRPRYRIEALHPGNPRAWPGLARRAARRLARRGAGL